MIDQVREFGAELGNLRGTSPEKIDQLVRQVRSDGKASFILAGMERLPVVGPIIRFLIYDLAAMPGDQLDSMIENAAELILQLRSDELRIAEHGDD